MTDPPRHSPLARPLRPTELVALDCVVGVLYVLAVAYVPVPRHVVPTALPWLLVIGIGAAVAIRRLWPMPAFLLALALSCFAAFMGIITDPFLAAAYVLYAVSLTVSRWRWQLTAAVAVLSLLGLVAVVTVGTPAAGVSWMGTAVGGLAVLGVAWTFGQLVRERRRYAENWTAQTAVRAVTDERLRIARELHDVVAHSMGVIAVKAGVANHVIRIRPEEAEDALRVIETTSRSALTEMRHMLGVLRADTGELVSELAPIPGLGGLPLLIERAEMAGVSVSMAVEGDNLPTGLDLTIYRIVQESLTNVAKHAAPAQCRVIVRTDGREAFVEVSNDGFSRRPADEGGHGLMGMRERVAMYGGVFTAGPRPEGGFVVTARLPYDGAS